MKLVYLISINGTIIYFITTIKPRHCLSQGILERISKILGDTSNGLTGSEISYFLQQCEIYDVTPKMTKWKRLYNAFASVQNTNRCSNKILKFVQTVLNPVRFTDNQMFEIKRKSINECLSYVGYELQLNGRFREVTAASTICEAQQRANDLLANLQMRNAHKEIFKYCTSELVDKNYFHAVFEACKGLFARIRQLSLVNTDGIKLVEYVFNHPVLVINSYKTKQDKDEQKGFEAILEGLCNMFRNPEAHQPKIEWPVSEQDALEILSLISYCHRRLDNTRRVE